MAAKSTRVALITGSTSGIGLGIAEKFAQNGISVMLHGLEENGAETASALAKRFGVKTSVSSANLLDLASLREMVDEAQTAFGRVDFLICNAGIQHVAPIEDFPDEKWNAILAVNLSSAFFLAKALWAGMKARGFGRIVNIASIHGLRASEFKTAYVAAKHGLIGLTKVLALEGAPFGITANAICPGYVKTPLVERQIRDQATAHGISEADVPAKILLKKQPIKEFVSVDSIAEMALMLVSEKSSAISGTSFVLDGAWSAQ